MTTISEKPWPAATVTDVFRALTADGAPFEMETRIICGRPVRAYKQGFTDLRALFLASRRWGDRDFLVFEGERLTYDEHFRAVAALARVLVARYGIAKGDRIAIAMRNFPEWPIVFWAAVSIGAVATPLNAWGTGDDLRYGVVNAGCKLAFADAERLERLLPLRGELGGAELIAVRTPAGQRGDVPSLADLIGPPSGYAALDDLSLPEVAIDPEDDATIFYTSGTTGRPKGALGTHRNAVTNILNVDFSAAFMALRRGDVWAGDNPAAPQKAVLLPAPFFHVTGCHSTLLIALAKGRKIVLMYKWNPERALELIEQERVTNTTGVPSMAWQLLESPDFVRRDLSSIEGISYGGAAAAPELTLKVRQTFKRFFPRQGYGATETSAVTSNNCGEDYQARPDSVGLATPVCDVKVVRADGSAAATGEIGEIWIYGPNVVKGYWNNPEATAGGFVDGWYRTGDVGRIDAEGFIYVLDRIKDMLIRGGENIYCVEVEAALFTHSAVLEAAVIGIPDRVLGEEVGAVVQLKPGMATTADELRAHAAGLLAAHKVPKRIEIRRDDFPRNASGKILKRQLRAELTEGVASA